MFDLSPFDNRKLTKPLSKISNNISDLMDFHDFGFKTDIRKRKNDYLIQAELPGVKKEDINVEVDEDYLTISAIILEINTEENESYIRKERRKGRFQRNFQLQNIKKEEIEAKYENGLLEVILPKENATSKEKRSITIN
ncbi:Hsp20/alpha crystallin family protein [Orenia marismortui]|uniref:Heat shock protein Hsp20 n=1 Tax=Orenia marismortui TaxID=46469 RepID=A0A4R8H7X3_9FIRM|nr:Hsp20/alpha crystallin family protein [Orenia marismortui]TDX51668.1 heat shock protein Hsp20 [Orenia marismortui]